MILPGGIEAQILSTCRLERGPRERKTKEEEEKREKRASEDIDTGAARGWINEQEIMQEGPRATFAKGYMYPSGNLDSRLVERAVRAIVDQALWTHCALFEQPQKPLGLSCEHFIQREPVRHKDEEPGSSSSWISYAPARRNNRKHLAGSPARLHRQRANRFIYYKLDIFPSPSSCQWPYIPVFVAVWKSNFFSV